MTTRLIMVRHGRGRHQDTNVAGGPKGDTGLTDLGRSQIERCAQRLARWPHVAGAPVFTSTLLRAQESAEIIAKAIDAPSVTQHCGLCSYHIMDHHDARPHEEAWEKARRGSGVTLFRPEHEGGDSWGQLALRAGEAFHEIAEQCYGKTVVIATHNEPIQASLVVLGYIPFRARFRVSLECGSITEWVTDDDTRAGGPADNWVFADFDLVRWNDTGHLED